MKFLRGMFLMLTIAAVSMTATSSFAQQEVDPDHYDQPIAAKSAVKAPVRKSTAQDRNSGKAKVASHRAKPHVAKPAA
jgi:hypothetical protein